MTFTGVALLLFAASLSAPGGARGTLTDQVTFVKILTESQRSVEPSDAIECVTTAGPRGRDALCFDWRTAIRVPFEALRSVTIERERVSREAENLRRWMDGLPELPATDTTISYSTVLTIRLSDESALAFEAFARPHAGELFDMRIGKERVGTIVLGAQHVMPVVRIQFAEDLTGRLRKLFAPLGNRVSGR